MSEETTLVKLSRLNTWIDEAAGIRALDVVRRVVQGNFPKVRLESLGKEWKRLERVFEALGPYEFEIYLQCQITGEEGNIKKRGGFYPSLLVNDRAEMHYENLRPSVVHLWRSPSLRHKDPIFTKLFPIECEFVREYWGRMINNPSEECFEESKLFIAEKSATDLWVSVRFDALSLIPAEFERARTLFAQGRATISVKSWTAPSVLRENIRAQIEACICESKKMCGESFDPLVDPESVLGEVSVETFPLIRQNLIHASSGGRLKVASYENGSMKPLIQE